MESRPERGVVRRLMWDAAGIGAGGDDPEAPIPAVTPVPKSPGSATWDRRGRPAGGGPGSQIRRYSPEPRPAPPAKKIESDPEAPIKQPG